MSGVPRRRVAADAGAEQVVVEEAIGGIGDRSLPARLLQRIVRPHELPQADREPGQQQHRRSRDPGAPCAAAFKQALGVVRAHLGIRSEEHTSELQSLMRISYAAFCLKKKNTTENN